MDKIDKLKNRYERWEHLKQFGGQDPFWEDGVNMNLVKNHIIHTKREMKTEYEEQGLQLPEIYYRETPPEVDNKYMARPDEIKKNAKKALEEYKTNKDYQYLVSVVNKLDKQQIEKTCISNVINYCRGLEHFISDDNLVGMRRHERYEHYLESFRDCRNRVEKILETKEVKLGQMSIFEMV